MRKKPLKAVAGAPDRPLVIGDIEIPCYVLEDETRVLEQRGFLGAIGRPVGRLRSGGEERPAFLVSERLKPFVSKALAAAAASPVEFQAPDGRESAYGYPATLLPQVCDVYLKARDAGALAASQRHIAERAEIIVRGLATAGTIALVDEATGYRRIREERALGAILERYVAEELRPWTRTIPYEFYRRLYKLRGWPGPEGQKRTAQVGRDTNDLIYERLPPRVLEELKARTPRLPSGSLKNRHVQWFTPEHGHPQMEKHMEGVMALMRAAPNWSRFKGDLNRAYPKLSETIPLAPDDEG